MSMSQEEIESLMNGLDFEDEAPSEELPAEDNISEANMSEDDINDLIAQTEDMSVTKEDNNSTEESVDDLLNSLEDIESAADISADEGESNIDDILKELDQTDNESEEKVEVSIPIEDSSNDDIDELLSTIDNIKETEPSSKTESSFSNTDADNIGKGWTDNKIEEGIFPFPVENDTKVVNQLSEVATDSEEKASKIFDVLSNILDYNNGIQGDVKELASFNEKQVAMLTSLSQKFPNIDIFKDNLSLAESMGAHITGVNDKLSDGNNEIFQAMELMQFHDINRQKIERVMSVIRKLSTYLNNLFEDDGNRQEVAVANHIHGDDTKDLMGDDDLESLIAEFKN